jgi:hypothetical protein
MVPHSAASVLLSQIELLNETPPQHSDGMVIHAKHNLLMLAKHT